MTRGQRFLILAAVRPRDTSVRSEVDRDPCYGPNRGDSFEGGHWRT